MLRLKRSPTTDQRKVVQKDQLRYWRSLHKWVVYLKILIREKYIQREEGKLGSNHTIQFSKSTWHQITKKSDVKKENWDQNRNSPRAPGTKSNIGEERVHRKEVSKSVRLMSVVLARQNSGKDQMRRPCTKKDASRRVAWNLAKILTSSRMRTDLRSILLSKLK